MVGGEFRWNDARVTEFAGVVDRNETIAAGFLQDEISLGRLSLLLGGRADRGGQGETSVSYRAGAMFALSARTRVRAGLARAFRAPTISDRYLPPTPFGPVIFVGNPDLKPETAVSAELGVLQSLGAGASLEVTGYAIHSKGFWDFIADTGAVFRAKNITRVPIYGVEASLEVPITPTLRGRLGYAFNDARYDRFTGNAAVEGNLVDDNVRHTGSASLTWTAPAGHVLWATGQYVGHRYTDPENTAAGRLDPYALVAIGGGVHVGGPVTLRVRVENLLDENYRTRPEFRHAGRAVYGGVQAGF
jgi:outer membrane receptor protein involved in Fe transport